MTSIVNFREWVFEVDKVLTEQTYFGVSRSGADTCLCNDCKNYVAYRDNVFPNEIIDLFTELGVDYKKEVEITSWQILPNGLHHIGGWFHFKGHIVAGKSYRVPIGSKSYTFDLTPITENFSIGFAEGNDLTFFDDGTDLIQIEFDTKIPWVIDKSLESV